VFAMKTKIVLFVLSLTVLSPALRVCATVLDFETLAHTEEYAAVGNTYVEDGFYLKNTASGDPQFAVWGEAAIYGYTGSAALFNDNANGQTVLAMVNLNAFTLSSIDLSELSFADYEEQTVVTFTGLRSDGTDVYQSFTLDNAFGLETFAFSSLFTDLIMVRWLQTADFCQFDNINVTPVPEPASLLLFACGLLSVAFTGKKRKARLLS